MLLSRHRQFAIMCLELLLILFKQHRLYVVVLLLDLLLELLQLRLINLHLLLLMCDSSFFLIHSLLKLLIPFVEVANVCFISLVQFGDFTQLRILFQYFICLLQNLCVQSLILRCHLILSVLILSLRVFNFRFHSSNFSLCFLKLSYQRLI